MNNNKRPYSVADVSYMLIGAICILLSLYIRNMFDGKNEWIIVWGLGLAGGVMIVGAVILRWIDNNKGGYNG